MDFARARQTLIDSLRNSIEDPRILPALSRVARELFVPLELQSSAYDDRPLNIGCGQTISQPYIVALMTQALQLEGCEKVLEVGTGSGYQTAVLAELANSVYSVERIAELAESAKLLLEKLGYRNIIIGAAGEKLGWPANAPYDAILVTAAAPVVHQDLLDQLKEGGRLVIPVGSRWEQELLRVTLRKSGNRVEKLGGCRFVPLIGPGAWQE
ncbi:MAG: protein-L-isoaspartate(D-aspartate) O-methyltransferase [Chloroflexi bacterium]|nr:protein-L-isoaspartate(D-aspartate) O-methyltransferase [Chloroflexota bacterium]